MAADNTLSHFDDQGRAHMVDVSDKPVTSRIAVAEGHITMTADTLALVMEGRAAKGDVLGTARLAGIMGAKRCADLIPLCHPLPITKVSLDLTCDPDLPGVVGDSAIGETSYRGYYRIYQEILNAKSWDDIRANNADWFVPLLGEQTAEEARKAAAA